MIQCFCVMMTSFFFVGLGLFGADALGFLVYLFMSILLAPVMLGGWFYALKYLEQAPLSETAKSNYTLVSLGYFTLAALLIPYIANFLSVFKLFYFNIFGSLIIYCALILPYLLWIRSLKTDK